MSLYAIFMIEGKTEIALIRSKPLKEIRIRRKNTDNKNFKLNSLMNQSTVIRVVYFGLTVLSPLVYWNISSK